jgi:tetratricopeptide (TPR) repeat protein
VTTGPSRRCALALSILLGAIPAPCPASDAESDDSKRAEAQQHFALGEQYRSSALFEKAAEEYSKVLELYPEDTAAYSRLGYVLTESGDYEKAATVIRRLIEHKPEECTAHESLGYLFLKQAHEVPDAPERAAEREALLQQAIEAYTAGLESCAGNSSLLFSLARAYRTAGRTAEAIEVLQRVAALNPSDATAYEHLADLHYEQKSFPEATQAYEALLALPQHGKSAEWVRWAEGRVAAMYRKEGDCQKAIPYYERILRGEPRNVPALEGAAWCYEKTDARSKAAAVYETLLQIKPEKASYYYRLGQILHDAGDYKGAIERIKEGLAREMDCSAHAHYLLGESYEKLGNYATAKREFERARDCNDPVFREKAVQQIERQEQLIKIQELEKKKKEEGY